MRRPWAGTLPTAGSRKPAAILRLTIKGKQPYDRDNKKARLPTGYGGDKRDRTADLLNAIQTLSQLSYTPM